MICGPGPTQIVLVGLFIVSHNIHVHDCTCKNNHYLQFLQYLAKPP